MMVFIFSIQLKAKSSAKKNRDREYLRFEGSGECSKTPFQRIERRLFKDQKCVCEGDMSKVAE